MEFVQPVQAFYDDDQPLMLVLVSYRSETEFSDLYQLGFAVYGSYDHPETGSSMLMAVSRSAYEQIHLTVESALIIDQEFDVSNYYIFKGDVDTIVSLPGDSETVLLGDSVLLVKTNESFALAEPLREKVRTSPGVETVLIEPTPDDEPIMFVENRMVVFVLVITILALLVSLIFYMIRRRKHDISKYF